MNEERLVKMAGGEQEQGRLDQELGKTRVMLEETGMDRQQSVNKENQDQWETDMNELPGRNSGSRNTCIS